MEAFDLNISVGRWSQMMWTVRQHTILPDESVRMMQQEQEGLTAASISRKLRDIAAEYNEGRTRLCRANVLTAASCGPAYAPAWLAARDAPGLTLAEVERRSEDLGNQVMPLWDAVCTDAVARSTNHETRTELCPME